MNLINIFFSDLKCISKNKERTEIINCSIVEADFFLSPDSPFTARILIPVLMGFTGIQIRSSRKAGFGSYTIFAL